MPRFYAVGASIEDLKEKFFFGVEAKQLSKNDILNSLFNQKEIKVFQNYDLAKKYAHCLRVKNHEFSRYPKTSASKNKVKPIFSIEIDNETSLGEINVETLSVNGQDLSDTYHFHYHIVDPEMLKKQNIIRAEFFASSQPVFELNIVNKHINFLGNPIPSTEDKIKLFVDYFRNEFEKNKNSLMINTEDEIELQRSRKPFLYRIMTQIPAQELSGFLNKNFDDIFNPEKYNLLLDKDNKVKISAGIEAINRAYREDAIKQAKSHAFKDTLKFCLGIITIPFAYFYYRHRVNELTKLSPIKSLFVKKERNLFCTEDELFVSSKPEGLKRKARKAPADKSLKEILFNKKNELRKTISHYNESLFFKNGFTLLGTKDQIQSRKNKEDMVSSKRATK